MSTPKADKPLLNPPTQARLEDRWLMLGGSLAFGLAIPWLTAQVSPATAFRWWAESTLAVFQRIARLF